jgi:hypothetical protein
MVAQPEFQPLLATVGQFADFVAGKILAAPNTFLSKRKQRGNPREAHTEFIRRGDCGHEIEVDGVATYPVIPDGMPTHDQSIDAGFT